MNRSLGSWFHTKPYAAIATLVLLSLLLASCRLGPSGEDEALNPSTGAASTAPVNGTGKVTPLPAASAGASSGPASPAAATQAESAMALINVDGDTLTTRFGVPAGYERTALASGGFGAYLRELPLKPHGAKVHLYDGRVKNKSGVYVAVADIAIGDRDLHQCADAIMLLRAQYLFDRKAYDQIHFNFTNGFKAEYSKWREGYRITVDGNNVNWVKNGSPGDSEESFRKFMDMVFAYAGTLSLEQELAPIRQEDMQPGDVFIEGGSPGHAVIVVDMAVHPLSGQKLYMLAQSYTPAQYTQILANPMDKERSPWYTLDGETGASTPEWDFDPHTLRRFAGE